MNRTSIASRTSPIPALWIALSLALCFAGWRTPASAASPTEDVQLIGLAPLYEALFAVANCPDVGLDEPAFRRAAGLYHLTTTDLTIEGEFAPEIAELAAAYRVRLDDDRVAFCDVGRLRFAVPRGVLINRGPEVPHPLPFTVER